MKRQIEWLRQWLRLEIYILRKNRTAEWIIFSMKQQLNRKVLNKYTEFYWFISSLIIQLCTEKIDITYYLYVIDWADSS